MATAFGDGLKRWRTRQGMSQLDLAAAAAVSQRHISFLETGRSKPSREMVLHLARVLDVPLREQNVLLVAAGHPAAHRESALTDLGQVGAAISAMLEGHEPHMAMVLDRRWNVVRSNVAGHRFLAWAFPDRPAWLGLPHNLMRMLLHPEGLRTRMPEWHVTAAALLRRLERDAERFPSDAELGGLLDDVRSYPGVGDLDVRSAPADGDDPVPTATYLVDGVPISLFTTVGVIGDARDMTLSELRIETFWPADPVSAGRWSERFGAPPPDTAVVAG